MAFIQPDILPAMAEAIHRQLLSARGGKLSRENLQATTVPSGMSKGPGAEKLFGDTLRELIAIGVLNEVDGDVRLPEAPEARVPGAFRKFIRTRAMEAELDSDLWEKDEQGSLSLVGARDLVRALAWFLNLDVLSGPYHFNKTTTKISELQEQQTGERPIYNEWRWLPFIRWARYLGFLSDMSLYSGSGGSTDAALPDPTRAVADTLPRFLDVEFTPIESVVASLAEALPVLDRGVYRRAILDRGAPEPPSDISPALTLAFQRLAAQGVVELEVGAGDASKLTFANNVGAFHAVRLVAA
jgi:hypothetical protein